MAKVSPLVRSFNAGEFSALMQGRPDLDRYPASMKSMHNYIAAPQGPAIARSGSAFVVPSSDETAISCLIPFVFSETQAKLLELSSDRIRFVDEDGIQVYAPVVAYTDAPQPTFVTLRSPTLAAAVDDQVVLMGFPASMNLNGEVVKITTKVGDVYTTDKPTPVGLGIYTAQAARVYHVAWPFNSEERKYMRGVQSVDVIYLLSGYRMRTLSRYGDYDWRIDTFMPKDGPYMPINETATTFTPSGTGNAIPDMTSNTAPSGTCSGSGNRPLINGTVGTPADAFGRNITYNLPATEFFHAFDNSDTTYWASDKAQTGIIQYEPAASFVCDGYTIYSSKENRDPTYLSKEYSPGTFTFEGWNGSAWIVLDEQESYVLYDGGKSVFFELKNTVSYSRYRLNITKLVRNGSIEPRVSRLVMRSTSSSTFNLTASSVTGINYDKGFVASDVGRLIRIKGSDGAWRDLEITVRVSATVVTVKLLGQPLISTRAIKEWRMGYWSDTTGYPKAGEFFEDRLWLVGPIGSPDAFAGSVTGAYTSFSQTDELGVVLDDSAIVGRLNSRKLSRILWVSSDDRGLVMGTGSEEYTLRAPNGEVLNARNGKARASTRRGSASIEPVRIDNQLLYVQRGGRTLREFAYVFEADGYKSPSMSQLASHLGAVQFAEMDYAAEPHSIVWVRRADGTLVGLTYNREENVIGWHRHSFGGSLFDGGSAIVESLAVLPQKDQVQDALWVTLRRTINGQTRRYIERLTPFWDFGFTIDQAHYVDSGLRYEGDPISVVYGLQHLEGEEVYGLANGLPVGPFTVTNGSVTLEYAASNVLLGLGFESECETSRLENGAQDGTAFGKVKRINSLVPMVWDSWGGEVGVWNEERGEAVYEPIEYPERLDVVQTIVPYTGETKELKPSPGYDMRATMFFKRRKDQPLPLNILCLMPQLNTQDR